MEKFVIVLRYGDIAFFTAAGFLIGIFIGNQQWDFLIFFVLICGIVFTTFSNADFGIKKYVILVCAAMVVGFLYFSLCDRWTASHTRIPIGKKVELFGYITDEPKAAGNFMMITLNLSKPYHGVVDIFTPPRSSYHYGDIIWVRGKIELSQDPAEDPVMFLPQLSVVTSNNGFFLKEWAIAAKQFISSRFVPLFSLDKSGVLIGIVTGSTESLSKDIKSQMNDSGTSYIVGMYGYKIAIICLAIATALKDHVSRKILLLFTIVIVWIFIFISGGSVSAVRAGIMGSLALIAAMVGRVFIARNALTFTALAMVLLDPRALTDAAFQLSFLSYLGIYYLGDPIKNFFRWTDRGFLEWKEHAMLALTTNLAIIPVVMNTFGGFSLTSFVSNILIMLPWAVIIFLGIAVALFASIFPPVTFLCVQLLNLLLAYELFVIKIFSVVIIPIPNIFTSLLAIIFYYGLLFIFIYYYGKARS